MGTLQIEMNSHDSGVEFMNPMKSQGDKAMSGDSTQTSSATGGCKSEKGEVGSLWVEGM